MSRIVLVAVLAAALAGAALAAPARDVNVVRAFAAQLPKVKKRTTVPILLPAALPLNGSYKLYATGSATHRSFDLELDAAPSCFQANACFVAEFRGERGGKLPWGPNVRLAGGDPATYRAFSCGGSCSPTSFWFTHGGVLYSWQAKDLPAKGTKAILVRMANQAIVAGPR